MGKNVIEFKVFIIKSNKFKTLNFAVLIANI